MAGPVIQTSAIPQQSAWFLQRGSGTTNTDPQTQVDGPAMNAYVAVTSDTTAFRKIFPRISRTRPTAPHDGLTIRGASSATVLTGPSPSGPRSSGGCR